MSEAQEFDHVPVPPEKLHGAKHFAALYAGEHIAGTEFVIGALFVSWGVSASEVILGLLVGNLLAVLTWRFVCAPIATETRMTLYAYLEKIAGAPFVLIYSLINGALFIILAGCMITVSASAVRIPFGIEPQTQWYPTDISFVIIAMAVGAVVVAVAVYGFKRLAQFASTVVPWMIVMFFVGALTLLPALTREAGLSMPLSSMSDFWNIAENLVWIDTENEIGFWHVAGFAWVCNLAMHGSLGDMSILRYARNPNYGYFSALGMFIGHFGAWIFAGIMGAGAGVILNTTVTKLDAGEVAYQALGMAGIIAVIIAGWTTSNPTLYRAGLAFQSLNPKWSRAKVTLFVGAITTVISCFPFVFTGLLSFVGWMGLIVAPVGAILTTEHWLFPKMGYTRYWRQYSNVALNWPALATWAIGVGLAFVLNMAGIHLFFLLIPVWLASTVAYIVFAKIAGAANDYREQSQTHEQEIAKRIEEESEFLKTHHVQGELGGSKQPPKIIIAGVVAWTSLAVCVGLGLYAMTLSAENFDQGFAWVKHMMIYPTLAFFISAIAKTYWQD